ncbi:MAG: RidA family protein [Labrys sp. (in: a-proteobacteria)]|jgi:enamine deaminase RidA (YjgF/YER057c/UK114 family)
MIKRIKPGVRYSSAVVHNGIVYLSGVVAKDDKGDVKAQTADVLAQIDATLAEAGSSKSKLLTANIWLTNIQDWSAMNEVWDAWIDPDNKPTRATVESKLAGENYRVEIQVTATV